MIKVDTLLHVVLVLEESFSRMPVQENRRLSSKEPILPSKACGGEEMRMRLGDRAVLLTWLAASVVLSPLT